MIELQRTAGNRGVAQLIQGGEPQLQRQLEVRPVRNKKTSAFGRRQELIDRLNTVSPAIQYELGGQLIE